MNPTELLAKILNNNLGNRITVELASGIVAVFNQALIQSKIEPPQEDKTDERLSP